MNPQLDFYPMHDIVAPDDHDALCGRGGHTIHWIGNIKFRALVDKHRSIYHSVCRSKKQKVVSDIVQQWRAMDPPGRFLTLSDPTMGDASTWYDIGDRKAQKKTAKRLREIHPESSPRGSSSSSSEDDGSTFEFRSKPHASKNAGSHLALSSNQRIFFTEKHTESVPVENTHYTPIPELSSPFEEQFQFHRESEMESISSEFEKWEDWVFEADPHPENANDVCSSMNDLGLSQERCLSLVAVSIPSAATLTQLVDFD